jgi:hypothetical protein
MRHDSNEIETALLVAVFSWALAAEVAGLVLTVAKGVYLVGFESQFSYRHP